MDTDKEENARLGVYWLIKASEQGNVEATKILEQCLETGQGSVSSVSIKAIIYWIWTVFIIFMLY